MAKHRKKQKIVCIMSKTGDCVYYVKNRRLCVLCQKQEIVKNFNIL